MIVRQTPRHESAPFNVLFGVYFWSVIHTYLRSAGTKSAAILDGTELCRRCLSEPG